MRERPPRVAEVFLAQLLSIEDRESVLEELHELFEIRCVKKGTRPARWWYRRQVAGYALQLLRHGRRRRQYTRAAVVVFPKTRRRGVEMLSLLTEWKHSFRRLLRAPVFTMVSVLTIGVGIGAFTSIFGLVETVLLERMPYERPDDVAWVWRNYSWNNFPRGWLGGPDIIGLREQDQVFEQVAVLQAGRTSIAGSDQTNPLVVRAIYPSHEFFDLLGVPPVHGRGFVPEDDDPNTGLVVVLGHDFWRRQYDADPAVVGETVYLAGRAATIVGVAAENFHFVMHRSLAEWVRSYWQRSGFTVSWRTTSSDGRKRWAYAWHSVQTPRVYCAWCWDKDFAWSAWAR